MERKNLAHNPDTILLITVAILVTGGLLMLYSASFAIASSESEDPAYYFTRQLLIGAGGIIVLIFLGLVDYHRWQKLSLPFLVGIIGLLVAVLVIGRGPGATRSWFVVGPLYMQPSEFAKLALVLYMAFWLPQKGESIRNFLHGSVPFGLIVALVGGLVARQPDYGTAIIVVTVAATVFFIAGADLLQLTLGGLAGGSLLAVLLRNSADKVGRFTYWWDPFLTDCQETTYQMCQALIALGSGGINGAGLGASRQKFLWLPAAQNDAIFAIIAEELGMIGALAVMALYAVFIYRGLRIALAAPDRFGALLATGVTCWITVQTLVNLGGITASLPLTGVTLPFISYGGSSLLTCLAGVGLLLNVSRQTLPEKRLNRAPVADGWWHRWTRLSSPVGR